MTRSFLALALVLAFGACSDDTDPPLTDGGPDVATGDVGTVDQSVPAEQGQPNPDQGQPNPDQGQPNPDQGQPNPDQGQPNPDQGQPKPDAALDCKGVPCSCVLDGKQLWGDVYFTTFQGQADFVVYETNFQSQAALLVQDVSSSAFATACGKWHEVTSQAFADFVVYKTTFQGQADFSVYYPSNSAQVGLTCSFCP